MGLVVTPWLEMLFTNKTGNALETGAVTLTDAAFAVPCKPGIRVDSEKTRRLNHRDAVARQVARLEKYRGRLTLPQPQHTHIFPAPESYAHSSSWEHRTLHP